MRNQAAGNLKRQRGIVFSVAFAAFMSRLDSSILNISLPEIASYFNATTSQVSMVVLVYMIVLTGTLMLFGKVADRWGAKRLFVAGYALFVAGSFLCGVSWSLHVLVAARFVQGLGGSMLYISAFTIIPRCLPPGRTGWAFGLLSSAAALAIVLGGPLGGLITGMVSWHWIFLINVPMGFAAIVFALRYLPPDAGPSEGRKPPFDAAGVLLSSSGLALFVYAVSFGHERGWASPGIASCLVLACAALTLFFVRERRTEAPIFDFSVMKNRNFACANGAALLAVMVLGGGSFLMPFYLQDFKGLTVEMAGFVTLAYSLVYMFLGPFAGRLSDRVHPRVLTSTGMAVALAGSLLFVWILAGPGLLGAILLYVLLAVGFALFISPNNNLVMGLAPREKLGVSAGMFQTVNNLGQTLGIAFFETAYSWNMAKGVHGGNAAAADPSAQVLMISGFQRAFLMSAWICALSLALSLFIVGGARTKAGEVSGGLLPSAP